MANTGALHGLGDDLHEFTEMQAKLSDGRLVRVTIDEDGHISIIALLGEGKLNPGMPIPGVITVTAPNGQAIKVQAEQMRQTINEMEQAMQDNKPFESIPSKHSNNYLRPPQPVTAPNATQPQQAVGPGQQPPQPNSQPNSSDPTGANAKQIIDSQGMYSPSVQELLKSMQQAKVGMAQSGSYPSLANQWWAGPPQYKYMPNSGIFGLVPGAGVEVEKEVTNHKSGLITHIPHDSVFQAKLESIMNDNQFDRRLRGRTRGKLDMTRLYKAQSGATNLFTQKTLRHNRKYNIALVVDESGSMYAKFRMQLAAELCQFLAEHFNRVTGLDLAIIGFSNAQVVHKRFGDNSDLSKIEDKIMKSPVRMQDTADHLGLKKAYELLTKAQLGEAHKPHNIVLLITDGDSNDRESVRRIRNQYKDLATEVAIGINIMPKQMEHAIDVKNLSDLGPAIVKVLRQEIKRG